MSSIRVYLSLGAAVLLYGTVLPASHMVTAEVPLLAATALRLGVAALIFLPLLWRRRDEWLALSCLDLAAVGLVALSLAAVSALMLCSTSVLPCVVVGALTSITPALTFAGAVVFLRDRADRRQLIWILLAAGASLSLVLIFREQCEFASSPLPIAAGFAAGLAAAGCEAAGTLVGKSVTRRVSPLTLTGLASVFAAVGVVPIAWLNTDGALWTSLSREAWLAAVWWGAGGLALGTWLWYSGVRLARGTTAAAFLAGLPIINSAMAWLLL